MGIAQILALANTKCIDFVGVGDSNQVYGGHGFDHGWQYALSQHYPIYGTGLLTGMENNKAGAGIGYEYQRYSPSGTQLVTTLPETHKTIWDLGLGQSIHYAAYSESTNVTINLGMSTSIGCPVLPEHALRFEFDYATFATGSGEFDWQIRRGTTPYTTYASGNITTNTGSDGWVTGSQEITADAARDDLALHFFTIKNGSTATAPVGFLWQNVIDLDVTNGVRYSTLVYRGGESLRTMAYDLQQMSDGTLSHYFSRIRARQVELSQSVNVVMTINSGLNDRNETLASVGPAAVADGDSPEAFVDNMAAVRNRIREIWTLNAWALSELHFLCMVSHPQSAPDDAELASYRAALVSWAAGKSDVSALDIESVVTYAALNSGSYYDAGGNSHLKQTGYEYAANASITALKVSLQNRNRKQLIGSLISPLISPLIN